MSDFTEDLLQQVDELEGELKRLETYLSYTVLLQQMAKAYREQGRLDPETLLAIDSEILENRNLDREDVIALHAQIEDALRGGATLLGWS